MSDVLILEPDAEVRELLAHVVTRMGHDPVYCEGKVPPAVVLIEPAFEPYLERALSLRRRHAGLPIVCASVEGPSPEAAKLRPVAFLEKPFELKRLQKALEAALGETAQRDSSPASSPEPLGS